MFSMMKNCLSKCVMAVVCFSIVSLSCIYADIQWPQVRIDANGNQIAIWDTEDVYTRFIQVSTKPLNGDWSAPTTISTPNVYSYYPFIEMNKRGDCLIAWLVIDPLWGITAVVGSTKAHDSSTWSTPQMLSSGYELVDQELSLTINDAGEVGVGWKTYNLYTGQNYGVCRLGSIESGWDAENQISDLY